MNDKLLMDCCFLGAGDGEVTKKIAKYFSNVYTTEMSPSMINLLQYKGYRWVTVNAFAITDLCIVFSLLHLNSYMSGLSFSLEFFPLMFIYEVFFFYLLVCA